MPPREQVDPLKRERIQAIIDWERAQGRTGFHESVFKHEGVTHSQGWRILKANERRHDPVPYTTERRGRPSKISPDDIHNVEEAIKEHLWDVRTMNWDLVAFETLGDRCQGHTLQRAMGVMDYHKCIVCLRGWVHPKLAKKRVEFAQAKLRWKPASEDWDDVYFSDQFHGGWGPTGKARIIRRPGERICRDCLNDDEPLDRNLRKVNGWVAAGYGHKSKMVVFSNDYLKDHLTIELYKSKILEPIVGPWIEEVQLGRRKPFWLGEDRNQVIGPSRKGVVNDWKTTHNLQCYLNCAGSPDLAPLEHCWHPVDATTGKYAQWDDASVNELMAEGWEQDNQEKINVQIRSMPDRLRRCIERGGEHVAE